MAQLHPTECEKNFDTLLKVLKIFTKKRYATNDEKTNRHLIKQQEKEEKEREKKEREAEILQTMSRGRSLTLEQVELIFKTTDPLEVYQPEYEIGKGGYGEVFLARSKDSKNLVAIKILKHKYQERSEKIANEVFRLKDCSHPNIVSFHSAYKYQDKIWVVMEYIDGGSIRQFLKERKRNFQEADVADVAYEVLKGLDYLHDRGYVHRDIKSANILFGTKGDIKIADLGLIAKKSHILKNRAGSKFYMAPEVILQKPYGPKIDIWSLGCVCQEMLELETPYHELPVLKALFRTAVKGAQGLRRPGEVSEDCRDFMEKVFMYKDIDRPSARELLKHPWLEKRKNSNISKGSLGIYSTVNKNIGLEL